MSAAAGPGTADAPVRLLVPFPPGGSTDFTARVLAGHLEQAMQRPVQVETETGDFGLNAVRTLARGPHDTLFLVGNVNTNSVLPVIHRQRMDFDYNGAVRPVTRLAEFPSVVMAHADVAADTLDDFLRDLKSTTGRLRYGTDFLGTYVDYDAVMLARAAEVAVAYHNTDGAVGILNDLKAGIIDLAMLNVATASANIGAYKPLAVTAPARLKNFPQVPTMAEAGYAGIGTSNWQGLFASSRASDDAVSALHRAAVAAMKTPEARAALSQIDAEVAVSVAPEAFAREIETEMRTWEAARPAILALAKADDRSDPLQ